MLFWAARIIKASSDSPLSFFHYLLTFSVARQPRTATAFDFKCSLLTGMKNAYLAEPRRNSCMERERERERERICVCVQLLVCQRETEMGRPWFLRHFSPVQKYSPVSGYNRICWVMNSLTNLYVLYTERFVKMNNDWQALSSQHATAKQTGRECLHGYSFMLHWKVCNVFVRGGS